MDSTYLRRTVRDIRADRPLYTSLTEFVSAEPLVETFTDWRTVRLLPADRPRSNYQTVQNSNEVPQTEFDFGIIAHRYFQILQTQDECIPKDIKNMWD